MVTPEGIERDITLTSAAARYDELWMRDAVGEAPLQREEVLELLALGEVIARKAVHGRQFAVRSARRTGASWTRIGAALGVSKQAAWEAHGKWIDEQEAQHRDGGHQGLDEEQIAAERRLAGRADD